MIRNTTKRTISAVVLHHPFFFNEILIIVREVHQTSNWFVRSVILVPVVNDAWSVPADNLCHTCRWPDLVSVYVKDKWYLDCIF